MYVLHAFIAVLLGFSAAAFPAPQTSITSDQIAKWYEEIDTGPTRTDRLDQRSVQELYAKVFHHPVASLDHVDKYDTPKGEIGFCFGRAMAAHLIARKDFGLAKKSIGKLFIVGHMIGSDGVEWRFHVTTFVAGKEKNTGKGRWYAIDPIWGRPLVLEEWVTQTTREYDPKEKAYLYFTGPDAVMPDVRVFPGADEETGERIIELKFTPDASKGFSMKPLGTREAWESKVDVQSRYFLSSIQGDTKFDYTGLTINGARYNFKGYFADLLAEIRRSRRLVPKRRSRALAPLTEAVEWHEAPRALGLKPSLSEGSRP